MAAQQLPGGRGRVCACGCLRSIDHMSSCAMRLPECKKEIHKQRKRVCDAARLKRIREDRTARGYTRGCKVCWGLPWARGPHREQLTGYAKKVGGLDWRCTGCGEPYEPEPKPEHGSLIGSSAGTAAAHGRLYGAEKAKPGEGNIGEGVGSSRAGKGK